MQRRFQGHLARLPQDCNWLLHVVSFLLVNCNALCSRGSQLVRGRWLCPAHLSAQTGTLTC